MRKLSILFSVVATLCFLVQPSFAKKICLQDQFGESFELKGGRIDKKSWTVRATNTAGGCALAGAANVTVNSSGQFILGMITTHDTGGTCNPVLWFAVGDEFLNSTGTYDALGDGSIDGNITFTNVPCSSLPLPKPKDQSNNSNGPLTKK
jgi:hypothetical protein